MKKYILTLFIFTLFFAFLPQKASAAVLFSDNFDSGNDNQWTRVSGQSLWTVQNGMYGAKIDTPNTIIDTIAGDVNWSNYNFEFDILPISGEDKNIRFYWTTDHGFSYQFHFNNSEVNAPNGESKSIFLQNGQKYHIKLVLKSNHHELYIDGTKTFDYYLPIQDAVTKGSIGFTISTGPSTPTEVYFDNVVVSSIDTDLLVPYFNQKDSPWGPHEYDSANSLGFADPRFSRWGCAVTSVAMLLNSLNITQMANNTSLNPDTLNTWLKNNKGFQSGKDSKGQTYSAIVWPAVSKLVSDLKKAGKSSISLESNISSFSNGISSSPKIDSDLTGNNPHADIVEVLSNQSDPNSTHFVVVKGKGNNTYNINDPYWNYPTLTSFTNKFYEIVQFVPSHTDLSYIVLSVNPKVNIIVTDPQGNKTGKTIINGQLQELNQIPNALYFYQGPISNPNDQNITEYLGTGANMFYLPKPVNGSYKIELSSQTSEFYTTNIQTFDTEGNSNLTTNTGSVTKSLSNSFTLQYNSSASSTPQKVITYESTLADIQSLTDVNMIKSKVYAAILTAAVKESQKQSSKNKLGARIAIDLFIAALLPERKKLLTEDAYQILLLDGQTLRKQLL